MEKVALIKCDDYVQNNVDLAVRQAIDLLGGMKNFVRKGQTVLLKANLVMKCAPEKCATTHPSVIEAVGKLAKEAGASKIIIADSAGGPFTESYMNGIYKTCGIKEVVERCGFELNQNYNIFEANLPKGKVSKKFLICDCLEKADVIINLSKLKTHAFTGFTNAVKNMFGAIPGLTKVEMHGQFKTLDVFGDFLYDILAYFKDKLVLNVCDAIIAMEGEGPTNGNPKKIGAVLVSSNATALDAVSVGLIGLNAREMPTIQTGIDRGFIDKDLNIEVLGGTVTGLAVKDFDTVQPNNFKPFADSVPRWLQKPLHRLTTRRPAVNRHKCKGCKKCFDHCPVQAISMVPTKKGGVPKAKFDYNKCIRCFCCQELCPFGLVKVKTGLIYKIIHIGSHKKKSN